MVSDALFLETITFYIASPFSIWVKIPPVRYITIWRKSGDVRMKTKPVSIILTSGTISQQVHHVLLRPSDVTYYAVECNLVSECIKFFVHIIETMVICNCWAYTQLTAKAFNSATSLLVKIPTPSTADVSVCVWAHTGLMHTCCPSVAIDGDTARFVPVEYRLCHVIYTSIVHTNGPHQFVHGLLLYTYELNNAKIHKGTYLVGSAVRLVFLPATAVHTEVAWLEMNVVLLTLTVPEQAVSF